MNSRFWGLFAILTLLLGAVCYSPSSHSFAQNLVPGNQTSSNSTTTKEPNENKTANEKALEERKRVLENDKQFTQTTLAKIKEALEKIKNERANALEKEKKALEKADQQNKRLNDKLSEERAKQLEIEKEKLKEFKDTKFKPSLRYSVNPPAQEKKLSPEEIYSKFLKAQERIQKEKSEKEKIPAQSQRLAQGQKALEKEQKEKPQLEEKKNREKLRSELEQRRLAVEKQLKAVEEAKKVQKEEIEKIEQAKQKAIARVKTNQTSNP